MVNGGRNGSRGIEFYFRCSRSVKILFRDLIVAAAKRSRRLAAAGGQSASIDRRAVPAEIGVPGVDRQWLAIRNFLGGGGSLARFG
jgi:hypothetical protein